jgi:LysR family transcriptional regulator, transcriptional activator of the cysJI operon
MNINLNQLKAFYSAARAKTFSKAAEKLFVTEPAVFVQVRSLERYLGFKLLHKFGKDLKLTENGKILYAYAEQIFHLVETAEMAMKDVGALEKGELRVGTTNALAQYLLPIILPAFNASHPGIQLYVEVESSTQLVKGILDHNYEIAIVARVPYPETIDKIPLITEEIVLITSPQSKLASKDACSIQELSGYPMICREKRSATRQKVWTEFLKQNSAPSVVIEAGNTELIKNLVENGRGASLLAKVFVKKEVDSGKLVVVPVNEGPFFLEIDVIHVKGRNLSPAAETFLRFLNRTAEADNLDHFVNDMHEDRLVVPSSRA